MEVYVGRQPIFDENMNVYGYELLYRRSENNWFEGCNDSQATAELIQNAFLSMQLTELTHGKKAFINFSADLLLKEIPLLLPKDVIVVEILERVKPTAEIVKACKKLKENGYILALDDFVFEEAFQPLIELADMIKMDLSSLAEKRQQYILAKKKTQIRFVAEKVETRYEYQLAQKLGFALFQGFFFCKPAVVSTEQIQSTNMNLMQIINELNKDEPDYQTLTEIIERDLGLSYRLFRIANSVVFGARYRVSSIQDALVRIGTAELKKWSYLFMLKEQQNPENNELIRTSLVRGRLMDKLAVELGMKNKQHSFFVTGLFSSIDTLLNRRMDTIIDELPLPLDVADALLGKNNINRRFLDYILSYEAGQWQQLENSDFFSQLPKDHFMRIYLDALQWSAVSMQLA